MPAGRRRHKLREYQRRLDAILQEAEELQGPEPPPISPEHAELRARIEEQMSLIEWLPPEDDRGISNCTVESLPHARLAMELLIQEAELLETGKCTRPTPTILGLPEGYDDEAADAEP